MEQRKKGNLSERKLYILGFSWRRTGVDRKNKPPLRRLTVVASQALRRAADKIEALQQRPPNRRRSSAWLRRRLRRQLRNLGRRRVCVSFELRSIGQPLEDVRLSHSTSSPPRPPRTPLTDSLNSRWRLFLFQDYSAQSPYEQHALPESRSTSTMWNRAAGVVCVDTFAELCWGAHVI